MNSQTDAIRMLREFRQHIRSAQHQANISQPELARSLGFDTEKLRELLEHPDHLTLTDMAQIARIVGTRLQITPTAVGVDVHVNEK